MAARSPFEKRYGDYDNAQDGQQAWHPPGQTSGYKAYSPGLTSAGASASTPTTNTNTNGTPTFTFVRSDTYSREVLSLPDEDDEDERGRSDDEANRQKAFQHFPEQHLQVDDGSGSVSRTRRSLDVFRSRSRSTSAGSGHSAQSGHSHRRLSQRLHLSRTPVTSANVPANLPEIIVPENEGGDLGLAGAGAGNPGSTAANSGVESQWEKRATILALENDKHRTQPASPPADEAPRADQNQRQMQMQVPGGRSRSASVSTKEVDATIQEAIRLHEDGQLSASTRMFGVLADPHGTNNPLSQVLYGLALRHGWGCEPDTAAAVRYLSAAASNAAAVESLALQAGLQRGGAAKGELVLAIFELANCFRHGWGIDKDPIAAKQYYETAANLGDTDAMNEIAFCYLEGFGCKKDKYAAAKYYRLAEKNGNKTLGNSWIWKDKYDPDKQKKK